MITEEVVARVWTGSQWHYVGWATVEDFEEHMTHTAAPDEVHVTWHREGHHLA